MQDLAKYLRSMRKELGKSQQEMADYLGMPQRTWANYESGKTEPKANVLFTLAEKGISIPGINSVVAVMPKSELSSEVLEARRMYKSSLSMPQVPDSPPPKMDIDDFSNAVDAHWREVKKVTEGRPVPLYSKDDFADEGGFEVPLLNQNLSAGNGSYLPEKDEADAFVRVPAHLKRYGKNLAALTVEGDSMYPTLDRGDLVICDSYGWSGEGIYALRMSGAGFVKRITRDPGKIVIISDNPKYPIREYKEGIEDFEIIGRVHCAIKNLE